MLEKILVIIFTILVSLESEAFNINKNDLVIWNNKLAEVLSRGKDPGDVIIRITDNFYCKKDQPKRIFKVPESSLKLEKKSGIDLSDQLKLDLAASFKAHRKPSEKMLVIYYEYVDANTQVFIVADQCRDLKLILPRLSGQENSRFLNYAHSISCGVL